MDVETLRREVDAIDWFHTIDLGQGVVTPGAQRVLPLKVFPPFRGKTVLDIGAWDGLYSFTAEREGASRVLAMDHYAWGVDMARRGVYWDECRRRGELPDLSRDLSDFWNPDLPRKRGFDLAHEALGSRVESKVADFMTLDPAEIGTFDIVLLLGVLYHLSEPLTALERVRRLTTGVAVIETEAIEVRRHKDERLLVFHPGEELLHGDFTNRFAFSEAALHAMCQAAGFKRIETKVGPSPKRRRARVRDALLRMSDVRRYRALLHAFV